MFHWAKILEDFYIDEILTPILSDPNIKKTFSTDEGKREKSNEEFHALSVAMCLFEGGETLDGKTVSYTLKLPLTFHTESSEKWASDAVAKILRKMDDKTVSKEQSKTIHKVRKRFHKMLDKQKSEKQAKILQESKLKHKIANVVAVTCDNVSVMSATVRKFAKLEETIIHKIYGNSHITNSAME